LSLDSVDIGRLNGILGIILLFFILKVLTKGLNMKDRLVSLLNCFGLKARVFQAGALSNTVNCDAHDGLGYIHIIKSGHLKVEHNAKSGFSISEPSLFFYMNPSSHRLMPQDDNVEMVCASFDFGAGLRNPLLQALPEVIILKLKDTSALETTLDYLFTEVAQQRCGRQAILNRLIEVIIIQLLRDLMNENRLQAGLLAGLANLKLAKAINAIHSSPANTWTLDDFANEAGMSRSRFAATFKETVGVTPGNYLAEWRVGIAQTLLRKSKSVQFVANKVGYGSASALSRIFTAQVGMSPTDWKKKYS